MERVGKFLLIAVQQYGAILLSAVAAHYLLVGLKHLSLFSEEQIIFIREYHLWFILIIPLIIGLLLPKKRVFKSETMINADIDKVFAFLTDPKHNEILNNARVTILQDNGDDIKYKIFDSENIYVHALINRDGYSDEIEGYTFWPFLSEDKLDQKFINSDIKDLRPATKYIERHNYSREGGQTKYSCVLEVYEKKGPYFKLLAFILTLFSSPTRMFSRKVKKYLEAN
ncbi:MAG: hypothetical protein COV36_05155 [Alphaproteobacteria bacterium CG11_big_fil_rev_8_21_14_0_20_44_7]|nr:MAG: hypothetical protein COV36_05155 [Alphaproteobacteria bacterium CG11_big_fil_rev_8_21_14_0_20_44_7]